VRLAIPHSAIEQRAYLVDLGPVASDVQVFRLVYHERVPVQVKSL
jgi:hypothetical protein